MLPSGLMTVPEGILYCFPDGDDLFLMTPQEGDLAWIASQTEAGRTCVKFNEGKWHTDEELVGAEF